ncbi:helix-turn-helix transcriptional regulator [Lactobacillus salivarius]|nr:helix-turn-helix transcriptional regulator [Ligilactobacillus salivarius]
MIITDSKFKKKGLVTMDNNIGYRISELRKQAGMSQFQLAKVLDIATSTLGMYETGKREPSLKVMNRIANYFNVTTDYLLGRPDKKDDDAKTADIEDDDVIFTYEGRRIPKEDLELIRRIMRGTRNDIK